MASKQDVKQPASKKLIGKYTLGRTPTYAEKMASNKTNKQKDAASKAGRSGDTVSTSGIVKETGPFSGSIGKFTGTNQTSGKSGLTGYLNPITNSNGKSDKPPPNPSTNTGNNKPNSNTGSSTGTDVPNINPNLYNYTYDDVYKMAKNAIDLQTADEMRALAEAKNANILTYKNQLGDLSLQESKRLGEQEDVYKQGAQDLERQRLASGQSRDNIAINLSDELSAQNLKNIEGIKSDIANETNKVNAGIAAENKKYTDAVASIKEKIPGLTSEEARKMFDTYSAADLQAMGLISQNFWSGKNIELEKEKMTESARQFEKNYGLNEKQMTEDKRRWDIENAREAEKWAWTKKNAGKSGSGSGRSGSGSSEDPFGADGNTGTDQPTDTGYDPNTPYMGYNPYTLTKDEKETIDFFNLGKRAGTQSTDTKTDTKKKKYSGNLGGHYSEY